MNKEQGPNLTTYEIIAMSHKHHKQPQNILLVVYRDVDKNSDAGGDTITLKEHLSAKLIKF